MSAAPRLEAHLLVPEGPLWSWSPDGTPFDIAAPTVSLFCWPPELWLERPTVHAFEFKGEAHFGFVLGWVSPPAEARALLLLCTAPYDEAFIFELLMLAHERIAATPDSRQTRLADEAAEHLTPLLVAASALWRQQHALSLAVAPQVAHPPTSRTKWQALQHEASLVALCRSLRPSGLLAAHLSVLLEQRVLVVGRDPLAVFHAVVALADSLAPLEFCGALIPLLPEGLHPCVPTLLNESVEPYAQPRLAVTRS